MTVIGFLPVGLRVRRRENMPEHFLDCRILLDRLVDRGGDFTPYLGVKLLPEIKTVKGGHAESIPPGLPAAAPFHHTGACGKNLPWRNCRGRVPHGGWRHGGREETILPELGSAGIAG